MDKYARLRRPKVWRHSDKRRRYRQPAKPAKPAAEATLQQLLNTVVDLSRMVKSAVDFYIYRRPPVDTQLTPAVAAAPPPLIYLNAPSDEPQVAVPLPQRETTPIISPPSSTEKAAVELPTGDPMPVSPKKPESAPASSKKRRRWSDSSSNSDGDDLYIDQKDALSYVLLPGARRSGQLMYVLEEKNLYVRRYSYQNYDRYDCKAPQCPCTVQLTKPAGVARRPSHHSASHQHAHMEDEYMELECKSIDLVSSVDDTQPKSTRSCIYRPPVSQLVPTSVGNVFVRLTDCSPMKSTRQSNKPTATPMARAKSSTASGSRHARSAEAEVDEHVWQETLDNEEHTETLDSDQYTPSGSPNAKSEPEVDERVWAEMLNIEEGHEISDMEAEFTTYRKTYEEHTTTANTLGDDDQQPDDGDDDEGIDTLRYEMVAGRRLSSKLLYTLDEKQLYRRKTERPEYSRYVCLADSCPVALRLDAADKTLVHANDRSHCHPNAEERYLANKFMNSVKKEILNSDRTPEQVYKAHAKNNARIAKLVPFTQIRSTMSKYKSRGRLRMQFESPDTLAGVAAAFRCDATFDAFGRSRSVHEPRSDFYRGTVDAATFGFSVFASATVVQHIVQSPAADRHYHVDGLVDLLPDGEYKELLVVYWEHKDCLYPVVYVLLTKRSRPAYDAMIQFVEERICNLAPVSIMCDFDFTLRNALRRAYPHCMRLPSHYQLVKAARRYALRLPQFFELMQTDADRSRVFHQLLHLPVLPAELMDRGFKLLRAEARTFDDSFRLFVEYVYKAWISNPGGPISVIGSESSSAKLIETYATALRSKIRPARKFFHYIDELGKDELQKAVQLKSLSGSGDVETDKPCRLSRLWKTIYKYQRELLNGKTTVADFLTILTNTMNALNMPWDSQYRAQPSCDVQDEDDGDAAEEIGLPLCEDCGAAEQRKIVLQPCGHVWKCHQCYVEINRNRPIACPTCTADATGHLMF